MTSEQTASQTITAEVTTWPGVTAGPGRRGEYAFKVGRREIGHLHGDHAAHFSFPKTVWAELMAEGRIVPHPVFPDSQGPAARRIEDDERDSSQHRPRVAAVARPRPLRGDQAALLVEAQRRRGDPASPRDVADREQFRHLCSEPRRPFDFKLT